MFAAGLYDLLREITRAHDWNAPFLLVGFAVSFVSALAILRPFTRFVQKHTFLVFAYYRILVGGLILVWILT
jgi:undecaprenyl-diphosphatase